jgi:hypothetical protein
MKKIITLFFFFIIVSPLQAQISIDSTLSLHTENILKITFNNNDKIKSAYYYLEAAKFNFKLFESEFTQFNPLIVSPKVNANSDREYSTEVTAGIQKQFFNGSLIRTSVGRYNEWGNNRGFRFELSSVFDQSQKYPLPLLFEFSLSFV